ncbi:PD-(D/E)XK nuclease-like domain-containing protein [Paenibacillus senegalimassiliensis]|uniref:PD-(D/E)XK nuclease-like domain-containing protein n=1 Tax=Paenibacillus senegalimassiliensis TaxID=1737426 RepID=UPI00073F9371|nr:PD-(D/E)XK nuclease-like domain-containing protein [Paenibacillus senegalimassiliensis]
MKLTPENYYSQEANEYYMSVSQYKDFLKCEAAALAKVKGEYQDIKKDALLLGSYVHAALESEEAFDLFKSDNAEIYTAKKELKAPYKMANKMIDSVLSDDLCNIVLEGDKEVILTAELFGIPWKAKLDVLNRWNGRFTDIKTVKGIRDKYWNGQRYVSFIQQYQYDVQMSVYAEIERLSGVENPDYLEPTILAVSKEDVPDKEIIYFDTELIQEKLREVSGNIGRVMSVKRGDEQPVGCGKCDYCKSRKKLDGMTYYLDLLEAI